MRTRTTGHGASRGAAGACSAEGRPRTRLFWGGPLQAAHHHYAAFLQRTKPDLRAGVVNAGAAKTNILQMMPWYIRAMATIAGPFVFNTLSESAHNAVEAVLRDDWESGTYRDQPGNFDHRTPIVVDRVVTDHVVGASHELTGA